MTVAQLPPVYRRVTANELPIARFEGDLYNRESLATQLNGFISRLPDGAVIGIDSQWGEGKTWFGRRWCASLQDSGMRTAYIDCFQRDYLDDPFTMIASEFIELAKAGKPDLQVKLLDAGKKLGAAILPAATKFAVNAVGHWTIGKAGLADDLTSVLDKLQASTADTLERLVSTQLADYQASKKCLEAFKLSLAELSNESDKPIVIFLDELDRCRPDFAVRTIERVKHFFEAPGVIFVLLLNRRQLEAAVEGLYGPKVDAAAYLAKFIPIALTLPKKRSNEPYGDDDNQKHCKSELLRLGFPNTEVHDTFSRTMGILATSLGFSLRDIERSAVLYSFAQPLNNASAHSAWPIALKIRMPDLYRRLCIHEVAAHQEAQAFATKLLTEAPDVDWLWTFMEEAHRCGVGSFTAEPTTEVKDELRSLGHRMNLKSYMSWLFQRIDLTVSA